MKVVYILEILIWVTAVTFMVCWFNNLWLMFLYAIPATMTLRSDKE